MQAINALAFYQSILLSGSQDEHVSAIIQPCIYTTDSSFLHLTESKVRIWDVSGFKPVQSVKVSSSVLAVDVWSHYLAIGSSVVQMVDMSSDEWRRIIFVEDSEGIPVCRHLQHIIYHNFVKHSHFHLSMLC